MANNFFDIFKSPFSLLLSPCLVLLLTAIQDQRAASCSQPLQEDFICHSTWKKDQNFPPYTFSPEGNFQLDSSKGKHEFHPHIMQSLKSFRRCFFTSLSLRVPLLLKYQRTHTKLNFQLCWQCPSLFGGRQFSLNCCPKETFQRKVYTQLTAIIIQLDPSILKKKKKPRQVLNE